MRLIALPPEKCLSCAHAWQRGWDLHCTVTVALDSEEPLPVERARAPNMPCGPSANQYKAAGNE